jgi:hypothetical protein
MFHCQYEPSRALGPKDHDPCLWPVVHPGRERCADAGQCADRIFLLALCEAERRISEPYLER